MYKPPQETVAKVSAVVPEAFYDLLAVFVPGLALAAGAISLGLTPPDKVGSSDLTGGLLFVLLSYLAGHLLYGASTLIVASATSAIYPSPRRFYLSGDVGPRWRRLGHFEPKFSAGFRDRLRAAIEQEFDLSPDCLDAQLYYELCRTHLVSMAPSLSRFVRKEQAYGELSRSLALVGLIVAAIAVVRDHDWYWAASGALVAALSWYRYAYAREIDAQFVYLGFYSSRLLPSAAEQAAAAVGSESLCP